MRHKTAHSKILLLILIGVLLPATVMAQRPIALVIGNADYKEAPPSQPSVMLSLSQSPAASNAQTSPEKITPAMSGKNWKDYAKPNDIKFYETIETNIDLANRQEFSDLFKDDDYKKLARLKAIFAESNFALTSSDLLGNWKCRSTQLNNLGVYVYTYFNCRVKQTDMGLFFEKKTGSQRMSGILFPESERAYVLLGGWTVNDEPQTVYSGLGKSHDSNKDVVGKFIKKKDKIVAIFSGSATSYEIYELIR